jgi:hypothetical protein
MCRYVRAHPSSTRRFGATFCARRSNADRRFCAAGAPELYRLLVIDRGWKTERYMLSLTKLLVDQLLLPAAQDS